MMSIYAWNRLLACGENRTSGWKSFPLLLLLLMLGCETDTAPKASHFEHDHVVASHWPNGLADAATKIRDRVARLDNEHTLTLHDHKHDYGDDHSHETNPWDEIVELVSWIPEIAADTNLAEADWLPLYQRSESLSANLRAANGEWSEGNRQQLESLCELIDQTAKKIPEQLPLFVKTDS
ncbi:hypothetical protein Pla22_36670 [Rubripirellula amarantea]|uniref:Uncharacterized protein n=1 Tax=Rubripirellula amarantea TaxID=2527999 RepID=A0A5C5WJD8_9BACT|nr:hypothetical protein [Rubripirellula amarantea]TWT50924.1 hypothetical protein Pla22_36670 [Rubripirellula amarantea]